MIADVRLHSALDRRLGAEDPGIRQPRGADMDIGGWLRSLGLAQYEAAFRENEIDSEVLPELAETDLEKLGMPLGHRKRLLKAIPGVTSCPTGFCERRADRGSSG